MGEVFAGRFELLEPIADGGMGTVWVVRDHRDGGIYAGKLLRQSDSGSLLRFIREQATRIRHPHVVTPVSWAGEDDRVLFTMPLVRGGSVATLVGDHGPLPASWVGAVLDQTLQALSAVHAAGIVHRDVKPANLLLQPTGTGVPFVLLSDFGIAAGLSDPRLTHASQTIGSPGYMTPEQEAGADPDVRQDVYGAGMVGLEMLTAVRPPEARSEALRVRDGDPRASALVDLLRLATDPDPGARPATVEEFRTRLAALELPPPVADTEGPQVFDQLVPATTRPTQVAARQTSPPAERRPVPPGRRALALALIAVAVACVVAAVAILLV